MYTENYDDSDFKFRHGNRTKTQQHRRAEIAHAALGSTLRGNRRQVRHRLARLNEEGVAAMNEQIIDTCLGIPIEDTPLKELALDRLQEIAELSVNQPD